MKWVLITIGVLGLIGLVYTLVEYLVETVDNRRSERRYKREGRPCLLCGGRAHPDFNLLIDADEAAEVLTKRSPHSLAAERGAGTEPWVVHDRCWSDLRTQQGIDVPCASGHCDNRIPAADMVPLQPAELADRDTIRSRAWQCFRCRQWVCVDCRDATLSIMSVQQSRAYIMHFGCGGWFFPPGAADSQGNPNPGYSL
jgi:hypothetical protein